MEFFLSGNGDQSLPYELQAFEVPLAATVRLFEAEAAALEGKLLPSLDRLTAKVTLYIWLTLSSCLSCCYVYAFRLAKLLQYCGYIVLLKPI